MSSKSHHHQCSDHVMIMMMMMMIMMMMRAFLDELEVLSMQIMQLTSYHVMKMKNYDDIEEDEIQGKSKWSC